MSDIFTVVSDLRAEIAQLRAQLAATWQPVEDGTIELSETQQVTVDGNEMMAYWYKDGASVELPDDLRLCRKVAKPTKAE